MRLKKMMRCAALLSLFGAGAFGQADLKTGKEPPETASAGRFRVTLTGLAVNDQTEDNILETDGKGDEVYILADIAQYDAYTQDRPDSTVTETVLGTNDPYRGAGRMVLRRTLVSNLIGDVNNQNNPKRIQAGSAGRDGGLKSGDSFPRSAPWAIQGTPSEAGPPMVLWEGVLRRGRDLVIIAPTVWEWDGGNPQLRAQYEREMGRYLLHATRTDENHAYMWSLLTGTDAFGAGDRPVGMLADSRFWFPKGVLLNYDVAQRASATASPYNREPGSVELRYFTPGEDYTLYLKVERR